MKKIIQILLLIFLVWIVSLIFRGHKAALEGILDVPPEKDTVGYEHLHPLDADRLYTPVLDDDRTLRECLQENKQKLKEVWDSSQNN